MFCLGLLGLVQATMGKEEEARAYLARVEAQLALLPAGILPTHPLLICLALTAMTPGDHERVTRLYPSLLAFGGQYYWFLVDCMLGSGRQQPGTWPRLRPLPGTTSSPLHQPSRHIGDFPHIRCSLPPFDNAF